MCVLCLRYSASVLAALKTRALLRCVRVCVCDDDDDDDIPQVPTAASLYGYHRSSSAVILSMDQDVGGCFLYKCSPTAGIFTICLFIKALNNALHVFVIFFHWVVSC